MSPRSKYWHIEEIRLPRSRSDSRAGKRLSLERHNPDHHKRLRTRNVSRWDTPGNRGWTF